MECEMIEGCTQPVTHIDNKGFIYCKEHGLVRRHSHPCRALRAWELDLLRAGECVPSYQPISHTEHLRRKSQEVAA